MENHNEIFNTLSLFPIFLAAAYPAAIKSFTANTDNVDTVFANDVNELQEEVAAIETALGVNLGNVFTKCIALTATRDLTAGAGNVAYTGAGFTPKAIIAFSNVTSNAQSCFGAAGTSKAGKCMTMPSSAGVAITSFLVDLRNGGTVTAFVATYDSDGWTLTWAGTGTGTANMAFLVLG